LSTICLVIGHEDAVNHAEILQPACHPEMFL
jgi:hypothetical protein